MSTLRFIWKAIDHFEFWCFVLLMLSIGIAEYTESFQPRGMYMLAGMWLGNLLRQIENASKLERKKRYDQDAVSS